MDDYKSLFGLNYGKNPWTGSTVPMTPEELKADKDHTPFANGGNVKPGIVGIVGTGDGKETIFKTPKNSIPEWPCRLSGSVIKFISAPPAGECIFSKRFIKNKLK